MMIKEITEICEMVKGRAQSFSFIWRDDLDYNSKSKQFELLLEKYLLEEKRVSEWPGTELDGEGATLRIYEYSPESQSVLTSVNKTNEFLSPDYPEDLAFYDASGKLLYASCSHENLEWFDGDDC